MMHYNIFTDAIVRSYNKNKVVLVSLIDLLLGHSSNYIDDYIASIGPSYPLIILRD